MNLSDPKHPWNRLVAAARTVRDERDAAAPYAFTTRVTALALAPERMVSSLVERFALRAVGVAGLLALVSVAANFSTLASLTSGAVAGEDEVAAEDAVTLLLSD